MLKKFIPLVCTFLLTASLFAEEKVYCNPQQIEVTSKVIYVHLGESYFEVDQLEVDQGGIFFTLPHARCPFTRKTINPKTTCFYSAENKELATDFPT
jgi:hypothetical protein